MASAESTVGGQGTLSLEALNDFASVLAAVEADKQAVEHTRALEESTAAPVDGIVLEVQMAASEAAQLTHTVGAPG